MLHETREGACMILTMDYPERRNALSVPMRAAIAEALERSDSDRDTRAIIITGAGGNFSAGGDITGMNAADLAAGRERFRLTIRLVRALVENSKPIIAAVEGWCVGAGLSLALCCDTIVAAQNARFAAPFGRIGLVADLGMMHTLAARIGTGRARQMMLYGEQIGAEAAERIGLVDHLTEPDGAIDKARERARLLAEAAPMPIALTKACLARGIEEALATERDVQSALFLTADHAEGKAAFLAKRTPRFKGA